VVKEVTATPIVGGFKMMRTPSPAPGEMGESPFITWGDIIGTPQHLKDEDDVKGLDLNNNSSSGRSFKINATPSKELYLNHLTSKSKSQRTPMSTSSSSSGSSTPSRTPSSLPSPSMSPSPRPSSSSSSSSSAKTVSQAYFSKASKLTNLSPAAQKLLSMCYVMLPSSFSFFFSFARSYPFFFLFSSLLSDRVQKPSSFDKQLKAYYSTPVMTPRTGTSFSTPMMARPTKKRRVGMFPFLSSRL
jgi:hypothetical protein